MQAASLATTVAGPADSPALAGGAGVTTASTSEPAFAGILVALAPDSPATPASRPSPAPAPAPARQEILDTPGASTVALLAALIQPLSTAPVVPPSPASLPVPVSVPALAGAERPPKMPAATVVPAAPLKSHETADYFPDPAAQRQARDPLPLVHDKPAPSGPLNGSQGSAAVPILTAVRRAAGTIHTSSPQAPVSFAPAPEVPVHADARALHSLNVQEITSRKIAPAPASFAVPAEITRRLETTIVASTDEPPSASVLPLPNSVRQGIVPAQARILPDPHQGKAVLKPGDSPTLSGAGPADAGSTAAATQPAPSPSNAGESKVRSLPNAEPSGATPLPTRAERAVSDSAGSTQAPNRQRLPIGAEMVDATPQPTRAERAASDPARSTQAPNRQRLPIGAELVDATPQPTRAERAASEPLVSTPQPTRTERAASEPLASTPQPTRAERAASDPPVSTPAPTRAKLVIGAEQVGAASLPNRADLATSDPAGSIPVLTRTDPAKSDPAAPTPPPNRAERATNDPAGAPAAYTNSGAAATFRAAPTEHNQTQVRVAATERPTPESPGAGTVAASTFTGRHEPGRHDSRDSGNSAEDHASGAPAQPPTLSPYAAADSRSAGSHVEFARASESARAEAAESTPAERTRIVDQITRHIETSRLVQGRQEVALTLRPEHLGEIRLTIVAERDQITARIVADNPIVRQAVDEGRDSLRAALEQKGFTLQGMDVTLGQNHQGNPFTGRHEAWASAPSRQAPRRGRQPDEPARIESIQAVVPGARLDYRV